MLLRMFMISYHHSGILQLAIYQKEKCCLSYRSIGGGIVSEFHSGCRLKQILHLLYRSDIFKPALPLFHEECIWQNMTFVMWHNDQRHLPF